MCPPKSTQKSTEKSTHTQRESAFDRFVAEYPAHKRIGTPAARTIWTGQNLDDEIDEILAGLERWKASTQWKLESGRYVPRPAAFLADQQWQANPSPSASSSSSQPRPAVGVDMAKLEQERAEVDAAMAALDQIRVESLKREVIARSGEGGKIFEAVDPADQSKPLAKLLRARIVDLVKKKVA